MGDGDRSSIIYVKTLANKLVGLQVSTSDSVREMKAKFCEAEGVPVEQQRLIFDGRMLSDEETLAGSGVGPGMTIHLVMRLADDDLRCPVSSHSPAACAEDVDVRTSVTVQLDAQAHIADASRLLAVFEADGGSVRGRRSFNASLRTVEFKPLLPLLPRSTYTVRVPASAFQGGAREDVQFEFTTSALRPLLLYLQLDGEDAGVGVKRLTFVAGSDAFRHLRETVAARLELPAARVGATMWCRSARRPAREPLATVTCDADILELRDGDILWVETGTGTLRRTVPPWPPLCTDESERESKEESEDKSEEQSNREISNSRTQPAPCFREDRAEGNDTDGPCPGRFLCALGRTIMSDPVQYPQSKKVVDRSAAERVTGETGQDPFDFTSVAVEEMIQMTELKREIHKFAKENSIPLEGGNMFVRLS